LSIGIRCHNSINMSDSTVLSNLNSADLLPLMSAAMAHDSKGSVVKGSVRYPAEVAQCSSCGG